jgi:hypothetical protein
MPRRAAEERVEPRSLATQGLTEFEPRSPLGKATSERIDAIRVKLQDQTLPQLRIQTAIEARRGARSSTMRMPNPDGRLLDVQMLVKQTADTL